MLEAKTKIRFGGVSTIEIDARMFELQRQRDVALNQSVVYAGLIAELKDENAELAKVNEQLQKLRTKHKK